MSDRLNDTKILTIHDKIQEQHYKNAADKLGGKYSGIKTEQGDAIPDMLQIMQVLQSVVDKLHSLDQYVRQIDLSRRKHDTHEGKAEVCKDWAKLATAKPMLDVLPTE
jgi:hypothetical protein